MRKSLCWLFLVAIMSTVLWPYRAGAQTGTGTITGTVADTAQGALPGAQIVLQPSNVSIASDEQGNFTLRGLAPGTYNVTISYVGFSPFTTSVTVVAGQVANVNAVLKVASQGQEILVTAPRAHGEAEAINEERTTSNILDVLPAKVITSLPNANIADAVGRLPSVTLERDEGEGKYVQIRGTEPRLSNLTIDGVEIPSPEGGVRQVKLDTIPADLVESVQIYKTLQADQPGDAIGGSVNIETKVARDRPTLSLYGLGGFTPIANTVPVGEGGATIGKRFGTEKRLGVIVGGSFDYNGRGIDDIEPCPSPSAACPASTSITPTFTAMDIREYLYDRKRYGFGGNVDYKLGNASSLYARTLFSEFKDYGYRYDYALSTNDTVPGTNLPSFNTERRLQDFQIASLILGGAHASGKWSLQWTASVARSRYGNPINGGESITTFNFVPATSNCQYNTAATKNQFLPQFTLACFTEMYNPANFQLGSISQANHGLTAQLNLFGSASAGRTYFLGSHPGIFQVGGSFLTFHKFDDSFENDFTPKNTLLMTQFLNGFKNPNYYGGAYQYGPIGSWEKVQAFLAANPSAFTMTTTAGGNSNNFDLIERRPAGYLMNTVDLGRFTLIAGVRFEGTQDDTLSFDTTKNTLSVKGNGSYVDVLPSAALTIRLDNNSDVRLAYSRGISRPDPAFLTTATSLDSSFFPPLLTIGNPALKPEHAHNADVLYERYLNPIGVVRGGFFYKSLSDPIVNVVTVPTTGPNVGFQVSQASNAGSAYIAGVEVSFEQHFTYFPGLLRGLGLFANYSYATSKAHNVSPGSRTDSPALLRQAPNAFNISPTYDRGRLSIRVGLAYNGPNINFYAFTDGAPFGIKGPGGDNYFFSHFQVDAQGSYRLGKGFTAIVSALNLNNGVFGFYNGSPQFFTQREYYKPTYTFGFRWDLEPE
ncbi:MAG: TonB-dependent receptor [Candidatus Acidiferrales bacterium]